MPHEISNMAVSAEANSKIIQLFNVTKTYGGGVAALQDVSVQVERGEFLFISGSSGAGKSTLLKIILGVERVTQGQLVVNGRNVTRIPRRDLTHLRKETGFVFQDFKLLENRSALENVALALQIHGLPPGEVRQRAYHALRAVGLADKEGPESPPFVRRGATARGDRQGAGQQSAHSSRGRAHRKPGRGPEPGDHGPVPRDSRAGHDPDGCNA